MPDTVACALCGGATPRDDAAEARWLAPEVVARIRADHPGWARQDGACPACVQEALLAVLLENGEAAFHEGVQRAWPLDAETAFGALPVPLRLRADARFLGRGITIAIVDAGFFPHPDLVRPTNRIRAWVDAGGPGVTEARFAAQDVPAWPGWDAAAPAQWHGLMTSVVAAGNGERSHGFYRGLAPAAELVLVQVRDVEGCITNESLARGLRWLSQNAETLRLRVVSISLGGDTVAPGAGDPVGEEVARLAAAGILVVAAAGNDGERHLVPPATSPAALTVGGIDDRNTLDRAETVLWHGNYGVGTDGGEKPEVVAPSLWVAAPVLPGTPLATEARELFERRAADPPGVEARVRELKLVTPHYQHVEGTSFAAPLAASLAACLLEADPSLGPAALRERLVGSARRVPGAPQERQGGGALDAGAAVARTLAARAGALAS
jgi:serine protease AprX